MSTYGVNSATTTDLAGSVSDVTISPVTPDSQGSSEEIIWDFPDANEYNGFYQSIPELKSALHVFTQRVCGLGYDCDIRTRAILSNIKGTGEDSFTSILCQALIESKVFGDSFTEIVRIDGIIINLKRLYTGDIRIVRNKQGLVERYEQRSNIPGGKNIKFKPEQILHLTNDRVGNEIHGTSVVLALKKIIDAKNEALSDERKIRHRELALGVLYVDTDDSGKLSAVKTQYQNAVKNGEVLVLPKDVAEISDNVNAPRDRIQWLQYLDNLFYQVVGTPKVLVTSEGFTEAGGKAGLLSFEPVEISAKLKLEEAIARQMKLSIKFKRAPSLLGDEQETQSKNAGQTGIQANETMMSASRTE